MCHQIPHGSEGKCFQFWFLIWEPLTLIGMGSVQGRLRSFTLVPIWLALSSLPVGEPIGKIQGNTRCGSPLGIFGTPHMQTSAPEYSCTCAYICCFTSDIMPWTITDTAWCSRPLYTVWWITEGGSNCLGSIPLSCIQQLRFGDNIPPCSSLSVVNRSKLPIWKGARKIFHNLTCKRRTCYPGWLSVSCMITWPVGFPQLRFPS